MTTAGRYHLLLTTGDRPVQHGWWNTADVARDKFDRWVKAVGSMAAPRITLTDEETSETLAEWPEPDGHRF